MAINNSQYLGKQGEIIAKLLLQEKGYTILETNWRYKKLEIDIIAIHNNQIVIIEVKARSGSEFGNPEDFVTKQKQKFLVSAANNYIETNNIKLECRFDVIAILFLQGKEPEINHLEDAFYASL